MLSQNIKKSHNFGQILGINYLSTQGLDVPARVEKILSYNANFTDKKAKFTIFTVNPELILMAQTNRELKNALNSSILPVPEAIGVSQAVKFLSLSAPKQRVPRMIVCFFQGLIVGFSVFFKRKWLTKEVRPLKGRLLFLQLIKLAVRQDLRVFLLGGEGNEASLTKSNLKAKYNNLKIQSHSGGNLDTNVQPVALVDKKKQKDAVDMINKFMPHLLFVAFNNPKQEIWIRRNLPKLKVKGAMAVGGTFRYNAGLSELPPNWMESLGLEWAWRLITEPYRLKRIVNAVVVFPYKVFLYKVKSRK